MLNYTWFWKGFRTEKLKGVVGICILHSCSAVTAVILWGMHLLDMYWNFWSTSVRLDREGMDSSRFSMGLRNGLWLGNSKFEWNLNFKLLYCRCIVKQYNKIRSTPPVRCNEQNCNTLYCTKMNIKQEQDIHNKGTNKTKRVKRVL